MLGCKAVSRSYLCLLEHSTLKLLSHSPLTCICFYCTGTRVERAQLASSSSNNSNSNVWELYGRSTARPPAGVEASIASTSGVQNPQETHLLGRFNALVLTDSLTGKPGE